MRRETKIICTLGPASSSKKILSDMAASGCDVVRLNFSHGDYTQHKKMIDTIRSINKSGRKIKILQDLEGYRIRLGHFQGSKILEKNKIFYMSNSKNKSKNHIPFDYLGNVKDIKKGSDVFIDDGNIHLKVLCISDKRLKLEVVQGGILKQRKGVNIPELKLQANIITEKDKRDLEFGIENGVDFIAQSFVRNKNDILRISNIAKARLPKVKIISKIESQDGVKNIDSIIDSCDGIMVARGDLGVTFPIYKVPIIQKYLIHKCNRKSKFVITATQMLESMTEHSRPTRAEVSDIANAILDGTNYVMLSAETAVGKFPAQTVSIMRQTIEYAEKYENSLPK
ncbi:MAG: pyruvate kinase [Candidatus Zapsychrus exili]|nr:pyruvate kinase [Candidatus Zapsychrus exili]